MFSEVKNVNTKQPIRQRLLVKIPILKQCECLEKFFFGLMSLPLSLPSAMVSVVEILVVGK